ncbi:mitochondrial ribosomal subunit S27 [Aureococcus anophagefferens]|nr:mitochondrial ribosomal subunit S27 [Aureococcus anophagefferens]
METASGWLLQAASINAQSRVTAHPSRARSRCSPCAARASRRRRPPGGALQRAAAAPRCSLSTTTGKAWEPPKAKVAPSSKRLDAISASIFGTLPSTNVRSGNKVLRKKLKGPPLLADYYFDQSGVDIDVVGREILSGWMNDREARRKNQLEILRRRGKGPPKKGMGKRSGKK